MTERATILRKGSVIYLVSLSFPLEIGKKRIKDNSHCVYIMIISIKIAPERLFKTPLRGGKFYLEFNILFHQRDKRDLGKISQATLIHLLMLSVICSTD